MLFTQKPKCKECQRPYASTTTKTKGTQTNLPPFTVADIEDYFGVRVEMPPLIPLQQAGGSEDPLSPHGSSGLPSAASAGSPSAESGAGSPSARSALESLEPVVKDNVSSSRKRKLPASGTSAETDVRICSIDVRYIPLVLYLHV